MEENNLVQLLINYYSIENNIRNSIRTTLSAFSTVLLSISGGVIIAVQNKSDLIFYVAPILGGLLTILISRIGYLYYKSTYRRQVEYMIFQAKLENILGFENHKAYPLKGQWHGEPIIPLNYLATRKSTKNSNDMINYLIQQRKYIYWYFLCFTMLGIIYIILPFILNFVLTYFEYC